LKKRIFARYIIGSTGKGVEGALRANGKNT